MNTHCPRERTKFWLDPQLNNLELLRATYVTYAFAPHTHDTFAIGVTESGAQAFTYRRTRHLIMPAGSVAIVHPGEVHTSKAADEHGWTYRMFYPNASVLQRAAAELAGRQRDIPFFPSPVIYDVELARRIRNFHIALEDSTTTVLERESRLLWILAHMIIRHAEDRPALHAAKPEPMCVQRVRAYLDEHFAEPVLLDQLATLVGLSPFHLLRVFRNAVGLPPHAYLTQVRVQRARRLLRVGVPIAMVAAETGFVDQSHLSKHFKRIVGVPPGHYRQGSKNIQDPCPTCS